MIDTILTASGIPHRQARFLNPPAATYAVYFDSQTADGPDVSDVRAPQVVQHDVTVELYEPTLDAAAEAALEAALKSQGIGSWEKYDPTWLSNVQRYQVVYEFTYYDKRRA